MVNKNVLSCLLKDGKAVNAVMLVGDEVVQWNGIRLRGRTFEEVYDIIFESKFDPQVELTVHRPVGNTQQRRNDTECLANTEGLLPAVDVY